MAGPNAKGERGNVLLLIVLGPQRNHCVITHLRLNPKLSKDMQINSNGILSIRKVIAGYEPLEALVAPKLLTEKTRRGSKFTGKNLIHAVKLTAIFILIACLQVSARTNAQRLSISLKNSSLEKLFSEIEQKTSYVFIYDAAILKGTRPVTVEVRDAAVEDILRASFKGQALDFSIRDKTIFVKKEEVKAVQVMPVAVGDGANSVSGVVRSETGTPLAGASVMIKKLKKSGMTDAKGEFILKDVPNGEYWVEISFVGYQPYGKMITVLDHEARVMAEMKMSTSSLDEVVLKGYYTTTKRLNTGDVTIVKGEDIQKQPVSDPILALEGRVPGLYIQQTSGVAGAYSTIRIRGQNSIANGNDPMYIVDGVPYSSVSMSIFGGAAGGPVAGGVSNVNGGGLSPFNNLNPSDIESIEVLKDADATAIYGSRGANGVILITTKKGRAGSARFNLNVYTGQGEVTRMLKLLNTQQYLAMRREAFKNDGLAVPSIKTTPTDNNYDINGFWDTTRYTNWQKVLIGNTATFTNAQGELSGGDANTQFVIGGGYSKQGTVFLGNYFDQKASAHFNLTHGSANQRFHAQFTTSYVNDNSRLPNGDFTKGITLAPDAPALYNANGDINWQTLNGTGTFSNPAAGTTQKTNATTINLISSLNLSYQILPGLQLKSGFGYNHAQENENQSTPSTAAAPPNNTNPLVRSYAMSTNDFARWIIEPQLDYQRKIGFGQLDLLIGSTFQQQKQNSFSTLYLGFPSDVVISNPALAGTIIFGGTNYALYRYNAAYGRLSYNWQDKYLLNLTVRRDGSSRFGPGKQFGDFGAIGVAWVFSKEKWIESKLPFLSFGKLRGSYGITGNDQIGDYQFLSTYNAVTSTYQGSAGLSPTRLTNPYFAWEVVKKLEGGLELGFFKDRILVTGSYYRNRTGNQLVGYALPSTTGFSTIQFNLPAIVQNSGIELSLNTINLRSKAFSWSTAFNLTIPSNKLVAFPNIANFATYKNIYVIGQSLFIKRIWDFTGVNPQTGLYTVATKNATGIPSSPQDLVTTKPVTQKYFGGFQNSISYKGFQLDIFVQFVKQTENSIRSYITTTPGFVNVNQPTVVLNRWESPGDVTNIQRFGTNSATSSKTTLLQGSNGVLTDGSFVRLKNLALSYQIPTEWKTRLHLQNLRFYIQCQNLFTFTKYLGLDPETGGLNLPPLRMITAGIQVGL